MNGTVTIAASTIYAELASPAIDANTGVTATTRFWITFGRTWTLDAEAQFDTHLFLAVTALPF